MPFRWKLTLLTAAIMIAAIATITHQFLKDSRKIARDQARQEMTLALQLFGSAVQDPLFAYDFATLGSIAEMLRSQDDVLYVAVYDAAGGTILADGEPGAAVVGWTIGDPLAMLFDGTRVIGNATVSGISTPIGAIRIDLSTAAADEISRTTARRSMANAIIAVLLVSCLLALGLRPLMRGVNALKEGSERIAAGDLSGRVPVIGDDEIAAAAIHFNEMTEALILERRALEIQANTDALTGLVNRNGLRAHIAGLNEGRPARDRVLIHIDLDNFKPINDTMGHSSGDGVLRIAAARIAEAVGARGVVARFGGDEFVALCEAETTEEGRKLAQKIVRAISNPIEIETAHVRIGASAGIAILKAGADKAAIEAAISNADIALYASKTAGRGRATVFDQKMRVSVEKEARLHAEAAQGIARGEFVPYFQPQIDLATGEVAGFECLMRWNHPETGLMSPEAFLHALRDGDILAEIDTQVRRQACSWLGAEMRSGVLADDVKLGLNVTQAQLRDPKTPEMLQDLAFSHGLATCNLAVEILETVIIDRDDDPGLCNVLRLAEAGFAIELDDFGTGYSSLEKLVALSVDRIKVDRSFVVTAGQDRNRRLVLEAIIGIGRSLGIEVLAEGAETETDLALLKRLGCSSVQGFAIAEPMSSTETSAWMRERASQSQVPRRA